MNPYFNEIKKNFGFGCMRLPMKNGEKDGEVDKQEFSQMVDSYLEQGFNYFDTAHGYIDGKSETAIRECLVKRHPRQSYILANKLSGQFFKKEEDIRPLFAQQLEACGVDYFDFYLMHFQTVRNYEKYTACRAYEIAQELKAEGKVRHVCLSFHDKAAVLDKMLGEHPEIEAVQIQFNYMDYDDPGIESRLCYEVCRRHGKPVIVMEPVKGGRLADIPQEAKAVFDALKGGSPASYAVRFAASFDGIMMVLSGMSNMQQLADNTSFMRDFKRLSKPEFEAVDKVCKILRAQNLIPCTGCGYCTEGCPKKIAIPHLFACMNSKKAYKDWNSEMYYNIYTQNAGKASDCFKCGKCEQACPQSLKIRDLLQQVSGTFDKTPQA